MVNPSIFPCKRAHGFAAHMDALCLLLFKTLLVMHIAYLMCSTAAAYSFRQKGV